MTSISLTPVKRVQTFLYACPYSICFMANKKRNLEDFLKENNSSAQFKSRGERKIAGFLEENDINFKYESGVLIYQSENMPRIWYPDFFLSEFSTYIEYYGMVGDPDYDRGIKVKETAYAQMGLSVIPVYPHMFSEGWQNYIMKEIKRNIESQYKTLMNKPFWE